MVKHPSSNVGEVIVEIVQQGREDSLLMRNMDNLTQSETFTDAFMKTSGQMPVPGSFQDRHVKPHMNKLKNPACANSPSRLLKGYLSVFVGNSKGGSWSTYSPNTHQIWERLGQ